MNYTTEQEYWNHVDNDPNHIIDYVDPDTGLIYFKCGCIEDSN